MALTIPINLNIENLAELNAQVAKMAGAAGGAGAGAAGRGPGAIGSLFGGEGGAGGSTAKGLGQIAKQLPAAGMMGDMVGAFKSGGIIGVGMAGVAGILGFVKQIMESSKVFQGIAGSFFKIFGAMADMFLLPFLPLAMRGMQMLMQYIPRFQEWGQKTADWIERMITDMQTQGFWKGLWMSIGPPLLTGLSRVLSLMPGVDAKIYSRDEEDPTGVSFDKKATDEFHSEAKRMHDENKKLYSTWEKLSGQSTMQGSGTIRTIANAAIKQQNFLMNIKVGLANMITGKDMQSMNLPGISEKDISDREGYQQQKGEQFSPVIKRGDQVGGLGAIEGGVGSIMNSMEVSLARQADKVKDYATQFQQKEVGAGGMLGVWDDEVLRGSIPDTWDSIAGMYRKMDDELADEARNAEMLSGRVAFPEIDPTLGLNKIADALGGAIDNITLSEFVLDPSVANDIENCFVMANQCLNTKFTSLSDLVEGGVEYIQAGVGGNIFDLSAINDLVSSAAGMGGAIETEAARIAGQVALMTQQMSDESLELTVDPKALAAEIRQLQQTIDAKVLSSANTIAAATANVNGLVDQWAHMANDWMDPSLGYGEQFGVLGAEYGEATGRAGRLYGRMKRWRIKRRTQVRGGGGGGVTIVDDDDDYDYGSGSGDPDPTDTEINVEGPGRESADAGPPITYDDSPAALTPETFATFGPSEGGFADRSDPGTPYSDAVMSSNIQESRDMDWMDSSLGYGEQFSRHGSGGRRGVQNTSHSVMNISINTRASVQDILSDLRRVQHMDDASFFNSVS